MSSPDSLSVTSRAFYERGKAKVAASIFLAAGALMLLGFSSTAGGISNSSQLTYDAADDDKTQSYMEPLMAGYGFACFLYLMAFIIFFAVALYISPYSCGTPNEKKILQNPHELEGGYSAYQENQPSAPSQV